MARAESDVPRCQFCGHMIIKDSQNRWCRFIADLPNVFTPRWVCHITEGDHRPRVRLTL